MKHEKRQIRIFFNSNTIQILTKNQQFFLTNPSNYSNNILVALKNLCFQNSKYINLTNNFLAKSNFLKFSYYFIKNHSGSSFSFNLLSKFFFGSIVIVNHKWFKQIAKDIFKGTYIFQDCQDVLFIKVNTKLTFHIRILKDKIVQKALKIILEKIFEKKELYFSPFLHKFNSVKSPHAALK